MTILSVRRAAVTMACAVPLAFAGGTLAGPSDFDLLEVTIPELQEFYASGKYTAVEVTQYHLDRIARYDGTINAVPVLDPTAVQQAAAADARRLAGRSLGPLDGVPVLMKDVVNQKGLPTTAGARVPDGFVATEDAFMVKQLRQAGAVIVGRTNLDTYQSGVSGKSELYGQTRNPYDITRGPGGSSGGAGAGVSSNFGLMAIAEESDGSIRFPADRNGVVGIKPTRSLVSTAGTTGGRHQRHLGSDHPHRHRRRALAQRLGEAGRLRPVRVHRLPSTGRRPSCSATPTPTSRRRCTASPRTWTRRSSRCRRPRG